MSGCFDSVTTFDHVGFECDGSWFGVQLEEEPACIAENIAVIVTSPEWCRAGAAITADGLMKASCQLEYLRKE